MTYTCVSVNAKHTEKSELQKKLRDERKGISTKKLRSKQYLYQFFLIFYFYNLKKRHTIIIKTITEGTTMFLKYYSLINYILYKNRREFENSFDCYPKKTVYEFYIRESTGGIKIRQKEHNAIHVSLFSNSGSYITLYLRNFTPEDLVAVMNSLIKQKKELGYERLICLLSELKNDERLSLLMKLSKVK